MTSHPVIRYPSFTRSPAGWRWMATAAMTLVMVTVGALWMPTAAAAEECQPPYEPVYVPLPGGLGYELQCQMPGGGGGGGGGGSGGGGDNDGSGDEDGGGGGDEDGNGGSGDGDGDGTGEPSCYLFPPTTYCNGTSACYLQEGHPPWVLPDEPKPSEDAQWMIETCVHLNGGTTTEPIWWPSDPDDPPEPPPPPIEEIAAIAYGQLDAPEFSLRFSPENLSFVGTDTYFWVEGLDGGVIEGTPAFGLIAVGVPKNIKITPGDGSPTFMCPPWPASRVDDCSWMYLQISAGSSFPGPGGQPSFRAEASLVYDIHFEYQNNPGVPVDVPNLPAELETLETDPATAAVPVGEIQALIE